MAPDEFRNLGFADANAEAQNNVAAQNSKPETNK